MSFEDGDEEALAQDLCSIQEASCQATNQVRSELLSLRAAADGGDELLGEVEGSLRRFGQMWGIDVELHCDEAAEEVSLSERVRLQLMRILNESLANVYRHARATRVIVSVESDRSFLFLRVADNGCGFDQGAVGPERLGIRIMRERAELFGGKLVIDSRESEGTCVHVVVPLLR